MRYLIGDRFGVAFQVLPGPVVDLFLIDLQTRTHEQIAESLPLGFGGCLDAISASPGTTDASFSGSADLLVKHVGLYRNNLYGMYSQDRRADGDYAFASFSQSYVGFFAMEMFNVLDHLSAEQHRDVQALLQHRSDDGDVAELGSLYRRWRMISGKPQ